MYPSRYTEFWGPSLWKAMHAIAFTYPDKPTPEQRKDYIDFFRSLGPVLPCPSCAVHYQEYINANPIEANDTESLSRWVYDLHDNVNKRNGKKSPSFEQIKDDYTGWNNEKHKSLQNLPPARRFRKLADPHLSRTPGSRGSESSQASEQQFGSGGNTFMIIAAACLLVYLLMRRRRAVAEKE